ncbi:MAG: hypothetical protein JNL36_09540 [Candidatus Kapabacteria bacterium]|nr:hypothetical protein [Candidatus Kapabacteria bacterium]
MGLTTRIYNKKVTGFCDKDECYNQYIVGNKLALSFQIKTGEDYMEEFTIGSILDENTSVQLDDGINYFQRCWKCDKMFYVYVIRKTITKRGKPKEVQEIKDIGVLSYETYKEIKDSFQSEREALEAKILSSFHQHSLHNAFPKQRVETDDLKGEDIKNPVFMVSFGNTTENETEEETELKVPDKFIHLFNSMNEIANEELNSKKKTKKKKDISHNEENSIEKNDE